MSSRTLSIATLLVVVALGAAAWLWTQGEVDDRGRPPADTAISAGETRGLPAAPVDATPRRIGPPEPNPSAPLDLAASPASAAAIRGRIVGTDGSGVEGAQIVLYESPDAFPFRGRTDLDVDVTSLADGSFTLVDVPTDVDLGVEIVADRLAPHAVEPLTVTPGEVRDLGTITLHAGVALEGRVHDESGTSLEGVEITVRDATMNHRRGDPDSAFTITHTDADGRYRVDGLARRQYEIDVTHPGYGRLQRVISLALLGGVRSSWTQDFELEPSGLDLGGRVLVGDEPVAETPVLLIRARGRGRGMFAETARTDADGRFLVRDLSEGLYEFRLDSAHAYLERLTRLEAGRVDHEVHALPEGVVDGTLTTHAHVPERFTVTAVPQPNGGGVVLPGAEARRTFTSEGGAARFRFDGLRPGTWRFLVEADGYAPTESADVITHRNARHGEVVIPLLMGGTITGRVVGTDDPEAGRIELREGSYDPGAPLEVAFPTPALRSVAPGEDGGFRLEHVAPGSYAVSVLSAGRPPVHVHDVVVEDGRETSLGTITPREGGTVRGILTGADGSPRAGARVRAVGERAYAETVTDANGVFTLAALEPGTYEISATAGELWEALRLVARESVTVVEGGEHRTALVLTERDAASR